MAMDLTLDYGDDTLLDHMFSNVIRKKISSSFSKVRNKSVSN